MNNKNQNLPKGWVWVKLGEVCDVIMGQSPPSNTYNNAGIGLPFFQGKKEFGDLHPIVEKWCSKPKKVAEINDILVSVRAPVGDTNLANQKCCIGRGLAAIRYSHNSKFILYYLRHIKQKLNEKGTGTTFKAISVDTLKVTIIPLPPLSEQHRIVAKIEELFSSLDKAVERLKAAGEQLKIYRQAVLKWAFEGRFTHKDIKQGELPKGWGYRTLSELTTKIVDGTHFTPTYVNYGIPFISVKDILNYNVDFSDTKFISEQEHLKLKKRCNPELGDILITKSGTIGRLAIVPDKEFSLFVSVALLKIKKDLIDSKFMLYSLQNHINNLDINSQVKGGILKNYHLEDLRKAKIVYMTLSEQQQIVSEIEKRLSVAEKVEESIRVALEKAERLRQSILKKAFEGKLVPQDPNDEPASVLLEKIKAEKKQHRKQK